MKAICGTAMARFIYSGELSPEAWR
jgi:hypothetical protein